jgi:AcrR family transcriptional regulator/predicted GNAT family acetyltransferase
MVSSAVSAVKEVPVASSPDVAEPRAPYSSVVRSDQARATRRAIVTAAAELFVERGYAATTIDAVADRAGVGRKTVFASVGSKGALLKLAWDWALVGDDEPVPMSERPAVQAALAEQDPRRLVGMWVDLQLDVGMRAMPIAAVVLAAADVDDEVRSLREAIRAESLVGASAFVTHLAGTGGLRTDLTVARAADACWALLNSLLQPLLMTARGWSRAEYREWLLRLVSETLLEPSSTPAAPLPLTIADRPELEHYEATAGNRVVGRLFYQRTHRVVVLTHTEVEPDHEDAAGALVRRAVEDVRTGGLSVLPVCPYVTWWLRRHPADAGLVHDPLTP